MCIYIQWAEVNITGHGSGKVIRTGCPFFLLQQQEEKVRTADDPFKFSVIYFGDQPCHMALAAPIGNLLFKFVVFILFKKIHTF